jgi:hypothetical protein
VTLASAEAKASTDGPRGRGLPQSFSTIACFSLEAIDITAALARCAMSRTEAPAPFAGRASTERDDADGAGAA